MRLTHIFLWKKLNSNNTTNLLYLVEDGCKASLAVSLAESKQSPNLLNKIAIFFSGLGKKVIVSVNVHGRINNVQLLCSD